MTPGVESATPSQALRDAAQMMKAGDFGSMPVVDEGRLVGMLTDRDIVVRAVAEARREHRAWVTWPRATR